MLSIIKLNVILSNVVAPPSHLTGPNAINFLRPLFRIVLNKLECSSLRGLSRLV
jgi:hypothetical protein